MTEPASALTNEVRMVVHQALVSQIDAEWSGQGKGVSEGDVEKSHRGIILRFMVQYLV